MPIKPENKKLYPANWREISNRIRFDRAGGVCEWEGCGAQHGLPHPLTRSKVCLTVAHLDHNPSNCAETNLKAYCQLHHLRYDAKHHAETSRETRKQKQLALYKNTILAAI